MKKKKETRGRKKMCPDKHRVLISARVAPDVAARLQEMCELGGMSLGLVIDGYVRIAEKVEPMSLTTKSKCTKPLKC